MSSAWPVCLRRCGCLSTALGAACGCGAQVVAAGGAEAGFVAPLAPEADAGPERGREGEQERDGPVRGGDHADVGSRAPGRSLAKVAERAPPVVRTFGQAAVAGQLPFGGGGVERVGARLGLHDRAVGLSVAGLPAVAGLEEAADCDSPAGRLKDVLPP